MKNLILFSLSLYLVSCASSGPDSTVEEAPSPSEQGQIQVMDAQPSPTATSHEIKREEKVAAPPVANSMYDALNEAIKSQNDETTQKAASDILMQNPKDIRGLNALAVVYYKKGRYDAAQYLLNKGIGINPGASELYSNLGLVYLAKNERKDAVKMFRKALSANPKDAVAAANLGGIYVQEKDYNKALLALEIPYQKGIKDSKVLNNYAIALTATGKTKEASDIYEKILKENPSQREVMLNYSILLIENLQKNKEGLDLLNRLKFVGAPAEARDTIKNLENKAKAGLQ